MFDSKKFTREIFFSFTAKGVALVFFISINIFLARYLGARQFGIWSFFLSIFTIILTISYSGIAASSRKFVAQYNRTKEINSVFRSSLKLSIFYGLCFAVVLLLIYKPSINIINRPDLGMLFLAAVPLILLTDIVEYLKAVFQGLHVLHYNVIINTLEYGLKFLFVFCLLSLSNQLVAIIYSFILSLLITAIVGFCFLYFRFYRNSIFYEKDFKKEILKYSVPLSFISIGFVMMAELDTVMMGFLSNDVEVGIYAVAKQIIVKLPHIALAIVLGTMPVFAKLSPENKCKLRSFFYRLLKYNTIIFGSIALGIVTASWFFVPLFFGVEYAESALVLVLLTPYLVLASYSVFFEYLLDYQGLAKKRAMNFALAIILNIVLNFILIPLYGGIGAAISTSISYLPYAVLNWIQMRKIFC